MELVPAAVLLIQRHRSSATRRRLSDVAKMRTSGGAGYASARLPTPLASEALWTNKIHRERQDRAARDNLEEEMIR